MDRAQIRGRNIFLPGGDEKELDRFAGAVLPGENSAEMMKR